MVYILSAAVMLTLPSVHINLTNKSAQKRAKYSQVYSKKIFVIRGRKKHLVARNGAVLYTSRVSHLSACITITESLSSFENTHLTKWTR